MVIAGVKGLFLSGTNGIQSVMGNYMAKNETNNLRSFFAAVEFSIHIVTIMLFSITAVLIVPFVKVYTHGVTDTNYIQPLFAVILVCAHAFHCLRLPYNLMILAGGHYKQTQWCYIIAALLNIVISIVCVFFWGLIGVAIGTLVAMIYQTIWMMIYDSKNFVNWPIAKTMKQFAVDFLLGALIVASTFWIKPLSDSSYWHFVLMGLETTGIVFFLTMLVCLIFYSKQSLFIIRKVFKKRNNG